MRLGLSLAGGMLGDDQEDVGLGVSPTAIRARAPQTPLRHLRLDSGGKETPFLLLADGGVNTGRAWDSPHEACSTVPNSACTQHQGARRTAGLQHLRIDSRQISCSELGPWS